MGLGDLVKSQGQGFISAWRGGSLWISNTWLSRSRVRRRLLLENVPGSFSSKQLPNYCKISFINTQTTQQKVNIKYSFCNHFAMCITKYKRATKKKVDEISPRCPPKEPYKTLFLPKHAFNWNLGNTPFYKSHTSKGFCKGAALLWYLLGSSWVCQYRCKNLLIQMAVLITVQYESGKPLQFEFPKSKLPLICMERQNRRARLLHGDFSCGQQC